MPRLLCLSACLIAVGALVACGTARRGEPIVGQTPVATADLARGERVFMAMCHQCHPKGEGGLAPAINDKPLPEFLMRFQVRNGIGAMPAFSERAISPEDLDQLMDYLKELRHRG